ncbi:hypothetical protein LCGC14_0605640 [marine sediment metagenome]|uniref:Uncharacterized protein n=2 Tax=root TaxID=1 RepID=A0A9C9NHU6_9HYPH|nr:hypothetical protein [Aurantimonas coralicida]
MSRRGTNGGTRSEADAAGRLASAAFPAVAAVGNTEPVHADAAEQFAAHLIRKGRKSGWLTTVVVAALFGTGGFFGMRAAGERRDEKIGAVETDAAVHDAKPAHDGAATRVEMKALEGKVQQLDTSVGNLGIKIDERSKAQEKQYDDIKSDLRIIRRRRRDP